MREKYPTETINNISQRATVFCPSDLLDSSEGHNLILIKIYCTPSSAKQCTIYSIKAGSFAMLWLFYYFGFNVNRKRYVKLLFSSCGTYQNFIAHFYDRKLCTNAKNVSGSCEGFSFVMAILFWHFKVTKGILVRHVSWWQLKMAGDSCFSLHFNLNKLG